MGGFEPPERIYGVDFSASRRDAGRNTWIARGTVRGDRLRIDGLADASAFLECDPNRSSTLDALAGHIRDRSGESVAFGLDFPFGLPASLLEDDEGWRSFLDRTPETWGALADVDGPAALYEKARAESGENEDDLRRETDSENGGQEPTGYRIKTQTYYGVSELLAEIADDVFIPPMDDPEGRTLVLETYPACAFEALADADRTGYKRDTRDAIDARRRNVAALKAAGVDFDGVEDYALASDDALDAAAAAYATFRTTRDEGWLTPSSDAARREGYIYGGKAIDADTDR